MDETQNLNGSTLDVVKSADNAKQDASSKQIMKDRYFLANILKAVVPEYKDVSEYDIAFKYIEPDSIKDDVSVSKNLTNQSTIRGLSEEDSTVNEGVIKYDVVFDAKAPVNVPVQKYKHKQKGPLLRINLKIDLEAQLKYDPSYPICKRAMYYCSRLLSAEFNGKVETIDYSNLCKVYSIWICFEPPEYVANTITRFKVTKEDVLGEVTIPEVDYNLMESVIIRLGKEEDAPNNKMYDLLYALFGDKPGDEKINRLQELGYAGTSLEKEAKTMISFSEWSAEKGYRKGVEQGMAEGITQGTYNMILKMYKKGMTIDQIAKISEVNETEVSRIVSEPEN